MSVENTPQKSGIAPVLILEAAIPVLSFGTALLGMFFSGGSIDIRIFAIGCVLGSFILAYLAWIRPHKDIVALTMPIYSFVFFILPSDYGINVVLELLYATSLTILLIRLKYRFGDAPSQGTAPEKKLDDDLATYCNTVGPVISGITPETAHAAALVYSFFARGDYAEAAQRAENVLVSGDLSIAHPALALSFDISREHAIHLEQRTARPEMFLEHAESDAGILARARPSPEKTEGRFEAALDNALLLLFAVAWNGSERDRPLLLNGQSFALKLKST